MARIQPSTLQFLVDLTRNNDRDWFGLNKPRYEAARDDAEAFRSALVDRMNQTDDVEHSRLYRIYRDVRFSKDKTPYKTRFGMSMSRRKPRLRGGYWVSIRPEGAVVSAGFWGPNSGDMAIIRAAIDDDGNRFRASVEAAASVFGAFHGEGVKTAPRGYAKDHPDIDLLRQKQFLFSRSFSADETTSEDFAARVAFSYQAVRPFFDHMSDVLSQDLNGRPLY